MKIWFDMTALAPPVVFGPVIGWLRHACHGVHVTARFASLIVPDKAVDEALIRPGRLRPLNDPRALAELALEVAA